MNEYRKLKKALKEDYPEMPDYMRRMIEEQVAAETNAEYRESKGKAGRRHAKRHPGWIGWAIGSAAAAFLAFSGICITHPVSAAEIPGIGSVFAELGSRLGFGGNFEGYTEPAASKESQTAASENPSAGEAETMASKGLSQTADGVTVTLQETYCNQNALYISILVTTEEAFPVDQILTKDGVPDISLLRSTFMPSYNEDRVIAPDLEGQFVNNYEYEGIMWIDLTDTLWKIPDGWLESHPDVTVDAEVPRETVELPEHFTADLSIKQIIATLKDVDVPWKDIPDEMPNEIENVWVDGPWNFHLDITVNNSGTDSKTVFPEGINGLDSITVTKTPFDLTLTYGDWGSDYIVAVTDANGEHLMPGGVFGGTLTSLATKGHDVSKITLYVCDSIEYLDEIKGKLLDGGDVSGILREGALWEQEIDFGE